MGEVPPEQFSFTAERKLMDSIKSKSAINAEVITLSRMAYRVINEIGGKTETNLSKCGKAMLVYSILNNNKKDLKLFVLRIFLFFFKTFIFGKTFYSSFSKYSATSFMYFGISRLCVQNSKHAPHSVQSLAFP